MAVGTQVTDLTDLRTDLINRVREDRFINLDRDFGRKNLDGGYI